MTADQWFGAARDVVMGTITVLVFFWGRDRKQIADAIDTRFKTLEGRCAAQEQKQREAERDIAGRFDRANHETSKLASVVQAVIGRLDRLPDELRAKFFPLDRATDYMEEARRDRADLWEAVKGLERRRNNR